MSDYTHAFGAPVLPVHLPYSTPRTPALDRFMADHHDPKWRPARLPAKPRPQLRRLSKSEAGTIGAEFQYRFGLDFRTITEPVSLDEFMARKSAPGWKPPAPKFPSGWTAKDRQGWHTRLRLAH